MLLKSRLAALPPQTSTSFSAMIEGFENPQRPSNPVTESE